MLMGPHTFKRVLAEKWNAREDPEFSSAVNETAAAVVALVLNDGERTRPMTDGQWIERGTLDEWEDRMRDQIARIAALEAERDELREALKPFARIASEPAVKNAQKSRKSYIHAVLLVAFLDATRAALAETEDQTNDG